MGSLISQYAGWSNIGPDQAIIWSGLTGFWGLVPQSIIALIRENNLDKISEEIKKGLIKNGFLVDENIDELALAKECVTRAAQGLMKTHRVILILNRDCNCRCTYCYQLHNRSKRAECMDSKVIEKSVQYARKIVPPGSKLTVSLFGGEPLLTLKILSEVVTSFREAVSNGFFQDVRFWMTTNGTLFNEDVQKLFSERQDLDSVQITFDGLEKNHDAVRHLSNGTGTFSTIWNNLGSIIRVADSVRIRINVRRDNISDVIALSDRIIVQFGTEKIGVYVAPIRNYPGASIDPQQVLANKEFGKVLEKFYRWYFKRTGKIHPDLFPRRKYVGCVSAFSVPKWISPNGALYQCQHQQDLKVLPSSSIFNDKDMHNFADLRHTPLQNQTCIRCKFLAFCGGACPADITVGEVYGYDCQLWVMQMKLLGTLLSQSEKSKKITRFI